MSKPLVYIAGPISKPDPLVNTRAAVLLYQKLINDDVVTPFCPHLSILVPLVAGAATQDYDYWLKHDFEVIDHCQALYRMQGESYGADQEIIHAAKIDIPVFYDLTNLYGWAGGFNRGSHPKGWMGARGWLG